MQTILISFPIHASTLPGSPRHPSRGFRLHLSPVTPRRHLPCLALFTCCQTCPLPSLNWPSFCGTTGGFHLLSDDGVEHTLLGMKLRVEEEESKGQGRQPPRSSALLVPCGSMLAPPLCLLRPPRPPRFKSPGHRHFAVSPCGGSRCQQF